MEALVTSIGELASLISASIVIGGALMWIYNKFIGEPRERKREREAKKRQEEMILLITEKNEPLNQSIQGLLDFSENSEEDRKILHRVTDEHTLRIGEHDEELLSHEKQLNEHNGRLIALETKNGITTYKFKEEN